MNESFPPSSMTVIFKAMATTLAILALYGVGISARQFRYAGVGGDALIGSYWMESAQRYRYVRMLAEGKEIPNPDTRMEAPDGYDPRSDTLLQEHLYGALFRLSGLDPAVVSPEKLVRRLTPAVGLLALFPLLGLIGVLTGSRVAAVLGCLAYAICLPAVERQVGSVLYREHLGIPLLAFHLFFLAQALKKPRWTEGLLQALFFVLALLSWKVMTFYALVLDGFFLLALGTGRLQPRQAALLLGAQALATFTALAFPVHLRFDGYPTSAPALLGLGVGILGMLHPGDKPSPVRGALLAASALLGTALLLVLLPHPPSYDHAWETLFAKARFGGQKPDDPSLLSFHARHFWSGNYDSPSLARALRDFSLPLLAALPGAWWLGKRARATPSASPEALLLYLTAAFVFAWILAYKLQAFPALLLSALLGCSLAFPVTAARPLLSWGRRGVTLLLLLLMGGVTFSRIPEPQRWVGLHPPSATAGDPSQVNTGEALGELANWLRTHTHRDDILLADFVISPFLLTYVDRPTVLHCFFESRMVETYRQYSEALFGDEEALLQFARKHRARYLIHQAHQTLRDDKEMSYRYVAAALVGSPGQVAVHLQWDPASLHGFRLLWENAFFRVFRVMDGPATEDSPLPPPTVHPLWDRAWFAEHQGVDPLLHSLPRGAGALALHQQIRASTHLANAQAWAGFRGQEREAEREFQEAIAAMPGNREVAAAWQQWKAGR